MAFTAKDVAALRETTGAGMMECKKALTEADGDMERAVALLREKGLAAAAKKASRVAAEGAVCAYVDASGVGAIVEINSETDFAAKSDAFQAFLQAVAVTAAKQNPADVDALLACTMDGSSDTVADALREKVLTIGENLKVRRFEVFASPVNAAYVHMGGKIGVLVNMEVSADIAGRPEVVELGRDVAMQTAAMRPLFLNKESVDEKSIAQEKEVFMAQAINDGKPQNVAEKMVAGRIQKYFAEVCLLEQPYVKDGKLSVGAYVAQVARELGGSITVTRFARYEKGEGLEKREDNFADEVAKMVQ